MAKMLFPYGHSLRDLEKGVEFEVDPRFGSSDESYDEEEFGDFKENLNTFDGFKKTAIGKIDVPFSVLKESMEPVTEDKGVMKQILNQGTGCLIPDKAVVTCHYEAYYEGNKEAFDSTYLRNTPYKFLIGADAVVPGLELGILSMKKGEISRILVSSTYAFGEMGCPPRIPGGVDIAYDVEVVNFLVSESVVEFEDMTPEDQKQAPFQKVIKIYNCEHEIANELFRKKMYQPAIGRYKKIMNLLEDVSVANEEQDDKRKSYLLKLYLNLSQCYINVSNPQKAIIYADLGLKLDPENPKALYRMGVALGQTADYKRAEACLNKVREQQPYNTHVSKALKELEEKKKTHSAWEQTFCKKMFGTEANPCTPAQQVEETEFEAIIDAEVGEFLRSEELNEFPLSSNYTEEELDIIKRVAQKHDLAYVYKTHYGEKIIKLAKKRRP